LSHVSKNSTYDNEFTLTDSSASFVFAGSQYITVVHNNIVYYGRASVSSGTELSIRISSEETLDGSTVNYEIRNVITTADLTLATGSSGVLASPASGSLLTTFTDSAATFLSDIETELDSNPKEPKYITYLRFGDGVNTEIVVQVVQVISDTQITVLLLPHVKHPSPYTDDLIPEYGGDTGISWTLLKTSSIGVLKRCSRGILGTVVENGETITVNKSDAGPSYSLARSLKPGDKVIITDPSTDFGEYVVVSNNFDTHDPFEIVVDHDFNATGSVTFDVIAGTKNENTVSFNSVDVSYDSNISWVPIFEVDSTNNGELQSCRWVGYNSSTYQYEYALSILNTRKPFLYFGMYEYYSPHDEFTGILTNQTGGPDDGLTTNFNSYTAADLSAIGL
tara:strand:- start:273 stop:1451 length:1179 start_codon:yes stop_codon:yes gene_type:complete